MNKEFTREEAKEEGLERGSILCEGSYSQGLLVEAFLCSGKCRGLKHTPWIYRASILAPVRSPALDFRQSSIVASWTSLWPSRLASNLVASYLWLPSLVSGLPHPPHPPSKTSAFILNKMGNSADFKSCF